MKKFLFLAVAFVAGLSVMAQKAEDVIKISADKHDFGKIKQGVPVTTYFTITNTTDKPVVIENAWAGCGCTTPEYSKEPIPAGGTSKLKVGYNAAAMGHFDKAVNIKLAGVTDPKVVTITYNGNSTKQIKIKGSVWRAPVGSAPSNTSINFLKQQMQ